MGSFRLHLAIRLAGVLVAAVAVLGGIAFLALRQITYAQLDEALLRLAEIEAAATSDAPASSAHFHDNVYQEAKSEVSKRISRYAEIWTTDGRPVARSENLEDRDLFLPPSALRAGAAGREAWFTHDDALGSLRSLIYPLSHSAVPRPDQFLQVAAPRGPAQNLLSTFLEVLLLIGLVGAVGSFGGAWYFAGQAMRPVREIAAQARRLEPGRSAGEIYIEPASSEHRQLVEVLNDVFDRLLRAVQAQRRFTADASHEIRTPLAIIQGDIEVALRRERTKEEYREVLSSTMQEARRLTRIADDLLTLAKSDADVFPLEIGPLDVDAIAADLVGRYRAIGEERGVALEYTSVDGSVPIEGDEDWLRRAIGNVLHNAVRYSLHGGLVRVSTQAVEREHGNVVRISVQDDGPGISPDLLPKLFQRFLRGDPARGGQGGSGLGLPIAKTIVEAHGGSIVVESEPGEGTRVELTLPAAAPRPKPSQGQG
ncbi:MAG: sensor histidine kinase [Gemmatimonadota bacterium]